jgi:DNA-binding ferritin-like protein
MANDLCVQANDVCVQTCNIVIATLKATYLVHQHNHWTSKGLSFYGNHLLFQRLYELAAEDLDGFAEKSVGCFGRDCVDYTLQAELVHKILLKYRDKSAHEQSLAIEKGLLELIDEALECFEKEKTITSGMKNFLEGMADNRETACYLLQQSLLT